MNRIAEEPFRLWKIKQKVHYRFDVRGNDGDGSADDVDHDDNDHVKKCVKKI